jgi:5-methyltetrahydrofolate--homocysteine methyltransferase
MKRAVAWLTPYMEKEKAERDEQLRREAAERGEAFNPERNSAGEIVLATVKGDVHDIGKNIVGVVLACNNYTVHDLGVMVPVDRIISKIREVDADIVGLSGLITPSLDEMVHNAQTFKREGIDIPLLIGGATTSKAHTAVKIDPEYDGPVQHVPDASRVVGVCSRYLNPETRGEAVEHAASENARHLERYRRSRESGARLLPFAEAAARAPEFDWNAADIPIPEQTGLQVRSSVSVEDLVPFIDWSPFFWAWELKGVFPKILKHPKYGPEATRLHEDGRRMLENLMESGRLHPRAAFGLWPANARDHSVELYTDNARSATVARFHFLRQQKEKPDKPDARYFSCSDFVAPAESGRIDFMGAFAVTSGAEIDEIAREYEEQHDDYNAILVKALGDRLAEAFAEYLHREVRRQWGFGRDENLSNTDLIAEKYRGIRPAAGYPATPDHTEKRILFELLEAERTTGISLTENFAMHPAGSVSGLYFAHPEARYFHVGRIGRDQLEAYAARKGMPLADMERWMAPNL